MYSNLGGLKFRKNLDTRYGQYSTDGGLTWENFNNGDGTIYFASSPANVAAVLPYDYKNLTADDFEVGIKSMSFNIGNGSYSVYPAGVNSSINYDATTGTLTFSAVLSSYFAGAGNLISQDCFAIFHTTQ